MGLGHSPSIITDGLVLCLDAANKRSYLGSGTVWDDLAGSNNGTLTNGPTFDAGNGGSVVFDGTNDYADLGNVLNITGGISISAWVKVDTFPGGSNRSLILSKGYDGTDEPYHLGFALNVLRWYTYDGSIHGVVWTHNLLASTWYLITGTFDGSAWRLYVDGAEAAVTSDSTALTTTTESVFIGSSSLEGTPSRFFDGSISNSLVYNRALNADEIRQNYNATKGRYA